VRIGLNLLYLIPGVVGGTETYARGLIEGFEELDSETEFVVFVNRSASDWPVPCGPRFKKIVCPVTGSGRAGRYLHEQFVLPTVMRRHGVELVHSLGYVAPAFPGCASVVTIPDVHFLIYGNRGSLVRRAVLGAFVRVSAARADRVIAISEFSKRETRIDCGYAVAFSSVAPNKNIPRLIRAFELARSQGLKQDLVIVGHLPPALNAAPIDGIRLTGYLDELSLLTTLRDADFLVFPSIYEGFGLPVLEAMASGVPVLSSNRGSLPEAGGGAALYFDPESTEELAAGLVKIGGDSDLRIRLRDLGLEQARSFSWEKTARETLAVYRSTLERENDRP
jgi:glycosyltransferase involved in cell wall biosynthesis